MAGIGEQIEQGIGDDGHAGLKWRSGEGVKAEKQRPRHPRLRMAAARLQVRDISTSALRMSSTEIRNIST